MFMFRSGGVAHVMRCVGWFRVTALAHTPIPTCSSLWAGMKYIPPVCIWAISWPNILQKGPVSGLAFLELNCTPSTYHIGAPGPHIQHIAVVGDREVSTSSTSDPDTYNGSILFRDPSLASGHPNAASPRTFARHRVFVDQK
jgi:hypothetical protein